MQWIKKLVTPGIKSSSSKSQNIKDGVWTQCPACETVIYAPDLNRNSYVCSNCNHHLRISARIRCEMTFDENVFTELDANIKPVDKLKFKDTKTYKDRLETAQKKTQEYDALLTAHGLIKGVPVVCAVFNFAFLGGSMGSVVGEKFVRAVNYAIEHNRAFICFTASGGARMQESLFSLMQMAKVSAALSRLKNAGLPYLVVLTDPTTGGVSASLAMLGDIHLAEPKALIGFAGPRVIEQTVRETLPEGFQRSEFLKEKGMVDMIVDRRELNVTIARLVANLMYYKVGDLSSQDGTENASTKPVDDLKG